MVTNEEPIAKVEGLTEGILAQLGDIRSEIRSTRNTLLMVNLLLWVATSGTTIGFFVKS